MVFGFHCLIKCDFTDGAQLYEITNNSQEDQCLQNHSCTSTAVLYKHDTVK